MSEGVNDKTSSLVDSSTATTATETTTTTATATATTFITETALESTLEPPEPPPLPPPPPPSLSSIHSPKAKKTDAVKKYKKFRSNNITYYLIDGKKIRSALTHRKWPPRNRRVSFPINDNDLVTGYLEPANPWEHADNVNTDDLISSYKVSCQRHDVDPMENLIAQLEKLDISDDERCPELSLKNECLDAPHCEPLEELLKRVQFEKIDVESSSLDDESATILFDMLEYYQSARHLNMSGNRNIGSRGWQACAQMIKRTTCLEQFEARDITLTQQHMNILKRPIQLVSHLHVLKLENCGLAGRAFVVLVQALKMNTGLKELYLADNGFEQEDAIQLGALLRVNNHLQLLDISNNHITDAGTRDLLDGLIAQSGGHRNNDKGLSILVLWNNDLTRSSSTYFSEAIAQSTTLETLNIGKNAIGNEFLELAQDTLTNSRTLLQLGMQSTNITCKGALLLAGIMERNRSLQRIDLRDNNIQMEGLAALSFAIKRNPCVTQLDLDPTPWSSKPATMKQYLDLVAEIRSNCLRNEEPGSTDESTEESGSPQHRSRLSSVSSRKISLTCQTLPRSPSSLSQNSYSDIATRTMLEPKRTSGGRLRSPAPSPIPSPVASPIPSPSRGRFVVSRVCETSLSSTNSSASSSPATPSSLGSSSPTCFFPPASVVASSPSSSSSSSSRFRVTVVGPPETADRKKFVVTPANTNITIGFNYKIQRPDSSLDSDDSDSVFRSDVEDDNRDEEEEEEEEEAVNAVDSSPSIDISMEDEFRATGIDDPTSEWAITANETKVSFVEIRDATMVERETGNDGTTMGKYESDKVDTDFTDESVNLDLDDGSSDSRAPRRANEDDPSSASLEANARAKSVESSPNEIIERYEEVSKRPEVAPPPPPPPRQTTSLKRLLGLFQHPGSLFSAGSEKTEANNGLQDRVNSMIALGDKFQQYLRDGRASTRSSADDDSTGHPILQRSASDATRSLVKVDPVKSSSVQQLSCVEASRVVDLVSDHRSTEEPMGKATGESRASEDQRVSRISEDSTLPETTNSLSSIDDDDVNDSSRLVDERKPSLFPHKLKGIEEYSILEIGEDGRGARETIVCDSASGTTDSIIGHYFKISSQCEAATCDIIRGDETSVDTRSAEGDVHKFFTRVEEDAESSEIAENSVGIGGGANGSDLREASVDVDEEIRNRGDDAPRVQAACTNRREYDERDGGEEDREESVFLGSRQPETVEEYFPLESTSSSLPFDELDPSDGSKNRSYDLDEDGENGERKPSRDETEEDEEEGEAKITIIDVDLADERVEDFFVRESSSAASKNEISIVGSVGNRVDDENYPTGIMEQFSSSLSDDSGYSGKLSMDETRNGRIVEGVALVTASVASTLESFLGGGESAEARLDSGEPMSSESSEDLMFKITDIDATGAVSTRIRVCDDDSGGGGGGFVVVVDRYYETGRASGGGLFIEKARNVHRNSQDSGIEEATASSISEENLGLETSIRASEHFQESLDSGIDSESSSVSARLDAPPPPLDAAKLGLEQPEKFADAYDDPSRITRIDDAPKIKDVLGALGDGT